MKPSIPLLRALFPVAAVLWLAGCAGSPQARFYTLNPLGSPGATASARGATPPVSVSVVPVEIPDYLDRPQIVTRDGRNELRLAEFDRWAGSLSENITAVLAENLALLLGTDRVFVYPLMPAEKAGFSVVTRLLRLDCVPGEQVLLKAQWTVVAGADRKNVATQTASFTERLSDPRYDATVAAVNRTLEQLSREIARTVSDRLKVEVSSPAEQGSP